MGIADWQRFNRKIRLGIKSAPSQETLIREGDKIRRIRPDGSDGGCFDDGGSGHSSHSDHQTDSADAYSKQDIAYARTPAKDLLSLAYYHQNESAKHELERRGLWLDTSSKESLSQYPSNQLLNYLELTKDSDLQRVKNERQNIMSEIHDRDDVSAEQTIKAMSTEELVVMRNEFIGLGGPPSFLRTAQLVYGELRNRRDQGNNKFMLVSNAASTPSAQFRVGIAVASKKADVPEKTIEAIIGAESSFNTRATPPKNQKTGKPISSAAGLGQTTDGALKDVNANLSSLKKRKTLAEYG